MLKKLFSLSAVLLLASAAVAHADAIGTKEYFTLTNGGSCCSPGPFGTILLEQTGAGIVTVTETLAANEYFAQSSAKEALEFNILGPITITVADTTNFGVDAGPYKAPPFGTFFDAVKCITCQGGKTTNPGGPLVFTVTSKDGVNVSDFFDNGGGYFASDIFLGNTTTGVGSTGDVSATLVGVINPLTSPVPEPSSLALLGTGLLGVAGMVRRRLLA